MSSPSPAAVFLSYAREDSEIARKIADALRGFGVEVWFDHDELRGGEAWDAKIRQQINACALFLPLISQHTQRRTKGYFRLEWKLAVDQMHLRAEAAPYLVPVSIGGVGETDALVPADFLRVQWIRLTDGAPTAEFVQQVQRLLTTPANCPSGAASPAATSRPLTGIATSTLRVERSARRTLTVAGGIVAAVAVGLLFWWRSHPAAGGLSPAPIADAAAPRTAAEKSIAVLAFENRSSEKDSEYFSDGISEELLNVLAKVRGLRVVGRSSSFLFKGKAVPPSEIGQKLGVSHLVEGSVLRMGSRARITAQLTVAATGVAIWSDKFDTELKDIFAAQDEIAAKIARELSLSLGQPNAGRTVDPEAHRRVLEARFFWARRTEDAFAKAESAALDALKIDDRFAPAHAALADTYALRGWWRVLNGVLPSDRDFARGREEAELAIELDPTLFEPWATRAAVAFNLQQFAEAERYFQKTFALNPNYAVAHFWHATLLMATGRLEDALREYAVADRLDPLSFSMVDSYARALFYVGRYEDSLRMYDRAAALRPDVPFTTAGKALTLEQLGRQGEALALARKVAASPPDENQRWSDATAAFVLRRAGLSDELRAHGERALSTLPPAGYARGLLLSVLGDFEHALPFAQKTPPPMFAWLYLSPEWDERRQDPRFQQLLAAIGCAKEYERARESLGRLRPPAGR